MATTNLGRVGLVLKGAYDAEAAYQRLDVVTYQNGAYAAKGPTQGHAPNEAAHWQPLADVAGAIGAAEEAASRAHIAALAAEDAAEDLPGVVLHSAAGRWDFLRDGNPVSIRPAAGSSLRVTPTANGTITHNGESHPAQAGVPLTLRAAAGVNVLSAAAGTLRVDYNRDSLDVLAQLAPYAQASGSVAVLEGLVDDLPLSVTARCLARQAGAGEACPDNVRPILPAVEAGQALTLCRTAKNVAALNRALPSNTAAAAMLPNGVRVTSTSSSSQSYVDFILPVREAWIGRTVTLKASLVSSAANNGRAMLSWMDSAHVRYGTIASVTPSVQSAAATIPDRPEGAEFIGLRLHGNYNGTNAPGSYTDYLGLQLELGAVATAYEPWAAAEVALSVQQALYGLPGAEDGRSAEGLEAHETALLTLDGTEDWAAYRQEEWTGSGIGARLPLGAAVRETGGELCTHLARRAELTQGLAGGVNGFRVPAAAQGVLYVCLSVPGVTDLASLKAWLADRYAAGAPVRALYARAEPAVLTGPAVRLPALPGYNAVFADAADTVTAGGHQSGQALADRIATLEAAFAAL